MEEKQQKKSLSYEELISRASAADSTQKFPISCNYYFILVSRHFDTLAQNKDTFHEVTHKLVFCIILLPESNLKERMLNFAIQNDSLNIFEFKPFLEKMINNEWIYMEEFNKIKSKCPNTYKNFNYERAIFDYNIVALSKVFNNISLDSAEKFLKISQDQIKTMTFKMIVEGKLKGCIDEKKNFIYFDQEPDTTLIFDKQIQNFCLKTKLWTDYIQSK